MIKTVLVPTDFCVASLNTVKNFLYNSPKDCKYHIILLHGYRLPEGISQLLFFSKHKVLKELTDQQFDEACTIIKNKFDSQIASIRKDIFTGFTNAAFRNYVEANQVELAVLPSNYSFQYKNKRSTEILSYIKKSALNTKEISCGMESQPIEHGSLADLFLSPMGMSVSENEMNVTRVVN